MTLPRFDISYYDLPVDNNGLYATDFAEGTELLVIYREDSSQEAIDKLEEILNATKIAKGKIARIEMKKISIALSPILRKNYITHVISFGVHPFNLGMKIPNNKYYANKFESLLFIYADSLEKLKDDGVLKGKLWKLIKNHLLK